MVLKIKNNFRHPILETGNLGVKTENRAVQDKISLSTFHPILKSFVQVSKYVHLKWFQIDRAELSSNLGKISRLRGRWIGFES